MAIHFLIMAAYALKKMYDNAHPSPSTSPYSAPPPPPIVVNDQLCLIGRTSTGKSSTVNALLGYSAAEVDPSHGTTTTVKTFEFKNSYKIVDTPGILDEASYKELAMKYAKESKIILYVTSGQVFEEELDFIGKLYCYLGPRQQLLLFVNKTDILEETAPRRVSEAERIAVANQVNRWIPQEKIAFGAAAPVQNRVLLAPRIDELNDLINQYI